MTEDSFQNIKIGAVSNFSNKINSITGNNQIFILCDVNTEECTNYLFKNIKSLANAKLISISSGEKNKNLNAANNLWKFLSKNKARRNSVLINLGGGLITDLGGFVASTYKRGITFINIPTSLLGMVDAAIGGKNGINLDHHKNEIGIFNFPELVICDPSFLTTLPHQEFLSGFAEVLKHGLIFNKEYWQYCSKNSIKDIDLFKVISTSLDIKNKIVSKDPKEKNIRKTLNFGHTIGHAIESFMLSKNNNYLHGHAVANGMLIEATISHILDKLSLDELNEIAAVIKNIYPKANFVEADIPKLLELMQNDKKNNSNHINFTLLDSIGEASYDNQVELSHIEKALINYLK